MYEGIRYKTYVNVVLMIPLLWRGEYQWREWQLWLCVSNLGADVYVERTVADEVPQKPGVLLQSVPRRCSVGYHWRYTTW